MPARIFVYLLTAAACAFTCPELFADTTWVAPGSVSGEWTSDGSPYIITGYVDVADSAVLSIGPGVTVFFAYGAIFGVGAGARLEAVGTESDSIYFTTDTLLYPERWIGIWSMSNSDTCRLEYSVIENSLGVGIGTHFYHGPMIVRHSTYRRNGGQIGIIHASFTHVDVSDCVFESNYSSQGGIVYIQEARGKFERCIFRNNHALTWNEDWPATGGAIYFGLQHDSLVFQACEFRDNSATIGGAIYFATGRPNLVFDSCRFTGNHAAIGGAIADFHNIEGARFQNCVFDSNTADSLGGAIYMFANPVDRCLITNNTAWRGGGIYIPPSLCYPPDITRNTIVSNTATAGAGIYLDGPAVIRSCIVAFNFVGEGIRVLPEDTVVAATLESNLAYGNAGGDISPNVRGWGEIVTVNRNGDSCDVFDNLALDPLFVDAEQQNFHLQGASPCIDAGALSLPPDPDSTIADIGAFYYHHTTGAEDPFVLPPSSFILSVYPNPFNAAAEIRFDLPAASQVKLSVFDLLGREVVELADETLAAGSYTRRFDARHLPSGIYVCHLEAGTRRQSRKLVLLK